MHYLQTDVCAEADMTLYHTSQCYRIPGTCLDGSGEVDAPEIDGAKQKLTRPSRDTMLHSLGGTALSASDAFFPFE